ncbi:exodeoxyribonuclease VII large subunit [Pectinatus frisingensis]|uniref:exodeoxyribonuclease VII large subunit n=1 Tax=Pectinatus frisingensis TaxID=865 RepID=UPI0018C553F0|nr:exodeoxyribonuclease VII large subunit [Pectinatus frisingensis]
MEIKQFGDWKTRNTIKDMMGVKAYSKDNEWYFAIDENIIDFSAMKALLPSAEYQKLCFLQAKKIEFAELFKDISKITEFPKRKYVVVGDVDSIYTLSDKLSMCILIDEHNTKRTLAVILKQPLETDDLKEKRIRVIGELGMYSPYARFQLENISELEIIGPCSRLVEYEDYTQQYKSYFKEAEQQKEFSFEFVKLGVISNRKSQGYQDFLKHLKKSTIAQENIILEDIKMTHENIIASIKKLNDENECQGICIIRGGGNPEELIEFSKPALLDTIIASKLPIITGVGHVMDLALCDYIADYNAGTPTGVAEYFNYLVGKKAANEKAKTKDTAIQFIREKKKHADEELKDLEIKYQKLAEENAFLEYENSILQQENNQLQTKLNEAHQNQKKVSAFGLIGKLFRF